jgi:hypothetical protein
MFTINIFDGNQTQWLGKLGIPLKMYMEECLGQLKLSTSSTMEVPLQFGSLNPRDASNRSKSRNPRKLIFQIGRRKNAKRRQKQACMSKGLREGTKS